MTMTNGMKGCLRTIRLWAVFFSLTACAGIPVRHAPPPVLPDHYAHQYNCPDLNIFWNERVEKGWIRVDGVLQNIWQNVLFDIHLYAELLDRDGRRLLFDPHYVVSLNRDGTRGFSSRFPLKENGCRIGFSFDYHYADYGGSVEDFGVYRPRVGPCVTDSPGDSGSPAGVPEEKR